MSVDSWRTVQLEGSVDPAELEALKRASLPSGPYGFHCLSIVPSVCGLGEWMKPVIKTGGNLAERGYDENDVARALTHLVEAAPSLRMTVHVGGDFETREVVATVKAEDGKVTLGAPEIRLLEEHTGQGVMQALAMMARRNVF